MREFGFELRLCARLEADGKLVSRQLGAGVHRPANRVVDVLVVEPGAGFDDRRAITSETIPDLAIEADVGAGRARSRRRAFRDLDVHTDRARAAAERAVEVGFFELERRGGRCYYRQVARYPEDWFGRLIAVENKPDLGRPGDLESQLRTDVALGLVDEVVLATGSYVTRAHRNRIPDPVGIWRFRDDEVEVVREPTLLPVEEPGVEIVDERPGHTEIRVVDAGDKARQRRRLAERAYGKGWRTYALPGCANAEAVEVAGAAGVAGAVEASEAAGADRVIEAAEARQGGEDGEGGEGSVGGLPRCGYHGRLVDPASECGPACPGFEGADPPPVDLAAERDRTSPWVADPTGAVRKQSGLDRFG